MTSGAKWYTVYRSVPMPQMQTQMVPSEKGRREEMPQVSGEAAWRRIAREAVAQLRKTADEIEAALNA